MGKVKGHQVKEVEDFVFHVSLSKDFEETTPDFHISFCKGTGCYENKRLSC